MGNNKKTQQPAKPLDAMTPKTEDAPKEPPAPPVPSLIDELGELFEKHGVKLAVAAFELPGPKAKAPAHVFYVGHFYDVAKMTAAINRQFVDEVRKELS